MTAYISLLQSLSVPGGSSVNIQSHLTDVQVLIVNIQHCLNSLRTKRANEHLLLIMRAQLSRKLRANVALDDACESACAAIRSHDEESQRAGEPSHVEAYLAPSRGDGATIGEPRALEVELVAAGERAGLRTLMFPSVVEDGTVCVNTMSGLDAGTSTTANFVTGPTEGAWVGLEGEEALERMINVLAQIPRED